MTSKNGSTEVEVAGNESGTKKRNLGTNWDDVRRDYVEGITDDKDNRTYPTLKMLALKYNVTETAVRKHSSESRWGVQREQWQQRMAEERYRDQRKKMLSDAGAFDMNTLRIAQLGTALITKRLIQISKINEMVDETVDEAIQRKKAGMPTEPTDFYGAVHSRELLEIANAAQTFQAIGMRAMGTDVNRIEVESHGGGDVTINTVNIQNELTRDDPERLARLLQALRDAGLDQPVEIEGEVLDDDEAVD